MATVSMYVAVAVAMTVAMTMARRNCFADCAENTREKGMVRSSDPEEKDKDTQSLHLLRVM